MRDLAITVVVALLIVLAGFRFWGYQKAFYSNTDPGRGEEETTDSMGVPLATSTSPAASASGGETSSSAALSIADQAAGSEVTITSVAIPEGAAWVAVRDGNRTLGAKLFLAGTTSGSVELLRPTSAGTSYTVVLLKDNGDRKYDRQTDTVFTDATGKAVSVEFKAL